MIVHLLTGQKDEDAALCVLDPLLVQGQPHVNESDANRKQLPSSHSSVSHPSREKFREPGENHKYQLRLLHYYIVRRIFFYILCTHADFSKWDSSSFH
jgi:hypothetical protein